MYTNCQSHLIDFTECYKTNDFFIFISYYMGNSTSTMCHFEEPFKKPIFVDTEEPIRRDGGIVYRSAFYNSLHETQWKKYWIMAILKVIHSKEDLEPKNHAVFSIESIQQATELQHKIWRGLQRLKFDEIYDTWKKMLIEYGIMHTPWNEEDCEFVRKMMSSEKMTEAILTEIVSFNKQGMVFTYELLGFIHQDIDDIFNWSRCQSIDCSYWRGLDEIDMTPTMSIGKQSSTYKSMSDLSSLSSMRDSR